MKIQSLKIKGIGPIADATIPIDKPLLVFYGEVRQGKSTLLNAVRWVCGGSFPEDIIKHGEKEASIELGFDGGCILRTFYRTKAAEGKPSEIKARAVQFVKGGKPVPEPASELRKLLNPFLINQDFFKSKDEKERKQYLVELFAVDTTDLDTEAFNKGREASALRSKLEGYGEIDLAPVEEVDTAALRQQLAEMRQGHEAKIQAWKNERAEQQKAHNDHLAEVNRKNAVIRSGNSAVDSKIEHRRTLVDRHERAAKQLQELQAVISQIDGAIAETDGWLKEHQKSPEIQQLEAPIAPEMPAAPDTSAIEAQLQNAAAQNVRAEQFKKNKERAAQRDADEAKLKTLEARGREIKKEKLTRLAKVSETCGVPGLTFDESGDFAYEGTAAGMLSTSQLMRLSSALSALYPPELGLGVELVDRGESLGRSIFDYVKHAEANRISVLATVVGQRPATVPENVGCWVVKDGVVLKDDEEPPIKEKDEPVIYQRGELPPRDARDEHDKSL